MMVEYRVDDLPVTDVAQKSSAFCGMRSEMFALASRERPSFEEGVAIRHRLPDVVQKSRDEGGVRSAAIEADSSSNESRAACDRNRVCEQRVAIARNLFDFLDGPLEKLGVDAARRGSAPALIL